MRVLIVSSDMFEYIELEEPLRQLRAKRFEVEVAGPRPGAIVGKHGYKVGVDLTFDAVQPERYQLLIVPGGKAPAELRTSPEAVAIARYFIRAGKPVAAICHGPQLLIATGLLAGRRATCYRNMRHELDAAGVSYEDRAVVVDANLITSRQPADIPAFLQAIFAALDVDHGEQRFASR